MAIVKTSELIGSALDWAVAKCESRVMRETVRAKYEDVKGLLIPFYLREVVCNYHDEVCVAAVVKDIKVIRCGVDASVGASAPSISFVASDGVTCRGSIDMFFLSSAEAELEAQRCLHGDTEDFSPSTNWSQGGPIIEREGIDTWCILVGRPDHKDPAWRKSHWRAKYSRMGFGTDPVDAETPLIAAMRCYIASKLGDTVEVPEELL